MLSAVTTNLYRCGFKRIFVVCAIQQGQLGMTRSLYTVPKKTSEKNRPCSALFPNLVFTRTILAKKRKRPDPPTDYLPFHWERKPPYDPLAMSGDNVRELVAEPTLPVLDVDVPELLKGVDDEVRKHFTLESGTKADLREVTKQLLLKKVQRHPLDFDSFEVKIALRTLRIRALYMHVKHKPRDKRGKVMLIEAIEKRNKTLKELRKIDMPRFEWLVKELGIEYTPHPLGVEKKRYHRKEDIRERTKEYCENLVNERRAAYHAELKEQQKEFLKEREEILAWIAEEEKKLGISKSEDSPCS